MFSVESIVYAWDNQGRLAERLMEDVTEEQMFLRPGKNMNHPAWILGHLSIYHEALSRLIAGTPFDDPKDNTVFGFGLSSIPEDRSLYPAKNETLDKFLTGHEKVAQALLNATTEQLNAAPSLARWSAEYETVGFMLPDLMLHHESTHIGQLSFWRRAAGLNKVEYPSRLPREGMATR